MSPRPVFMLGRRGRSVRVVVRTSRGVKRYVVTWTDTKPRTQWFPCTKPGRAEAEAFAAGVYLRLDRPVEEVKPRLTTEQLFQRFRESQYDHLRPRSRQLYADHWSDWQNVVGPHVVAEDLDAATCERVRDALKGRLGINSLSKLFQTVRTVYRWAQTYDHIRVNKVGLYVFKVGKDRRPAPPPEYSQAEFERLLDALPITNGAHWRAHVVLAVCGWQGARQNQVLHLDWSDLDWAGARMHWRSEWDKMGHDRWQPMRAPVRELLSRIWEAKDRPGSGWVLPAASPRSGQPTYTIGAFWRALQNAEVRAKVPHLKGRGGHGFRRLLAGNVAAATGNAKMAMDAIGDRDIKQLNRYVQVREGDLRSVFATMDRTPESANESATAGPGATGSGGNTR